MRRLPPFFALRALEAAARHRSYSRAARELFVTHGAVSQQIRKLEDDLGAKLFVRQGNAMVPTATGQRLADQVTTALAAQVVSSPAIGGPTLSAEANSRERMAVPAIRSSFIGAPVSMSVGQSGLAQTRCPFRAGFTNDGI